MEVSIFTLQCNASFSRTRAQARLWAIALYVEAAFYAVEFKTAREVLGNIFLPNGAEYYRSTADVVATYRGDDYAVDAAFYAVRITCEAKFHKRPTLEELRLVARQAAFANRWITSKGAL